MAPRKKAPPLTRALKTLALVLIVLLSAITVPCDAKKRSEISKELHSKRNSKEYSVKVLPTSVVVSEKLNVCDAYEAKHINVICHCSANDNATSAVCTVFGTGEPENSTFWDSFSAQPFLEKLTINIRLKDVQHHFIPTNALKSLRRLRYFQLLYASVTEVPPFAFANLSSLEELNLKNNGITVLKLRSFAWMSNLTRVTLSGNSIGEIQRDVFMGVTALKHLYLDENNISVIYDRAFFHLTSLAELHLDRNQLEVLTREVFLGLKSLQVLQLDRNHLRMLGESNFCEMPNLKELSLAHNNITFINGRAFEGLRSLERLDLEGNQIKAILPPTFVGLTKVYYLNLRKNVLETLTLDTMKPFMTQFYNESTTFNLEENNYICDCRISWMITVRNETPSDVMRDVLNDVTCTLRNSESNSVTNSDGVSYAVIDKSAKTVSSDPGNLQEVAPHEVKSKEEEDENLGPTRISDETKLNEEQADSGPVFMLSSVQPEDLPCPEELKAKPAPSEGTDILAEESSNSSNHMSEMQNLATLTDSSASRSLSSVVLVVSVVLLIT